MHAMLETVRPTMLFSALYHKTDRNRGSADMVKCLLSPHGRHRSGDGSFPKADIVRRAAIDRVWDFPLSQRRSAIHGIADIPRGAPIVIARIFMWIASLALADLDDIVVCRRR